MLSLVQIKLGFVLLFKICFRRFTTELAKKAERVVAVDFMEDFVEKNKKENYHMGNIEFVVADVTKMERPKER